MKFSIRLSLSLALLTRFSTASPIIDIRNATLVAAERGNYPAMKYFVLPANVLKATPTTAVAAAELSNMQFFAQYAGAAYCNAVKSMVGIEISCSNGVCPSLTAVTNYAFLGYDQSEASGFVGIDATNKLIVVSYAGSANFDNYVADLLAPLESCSDLVSGCKMHQGFQYAWEDVQDTTMPAVKAAVAAYPTYSVIATGHSLGGAVATVAGAYLRAAGIPTDIYSYGSPRIGNEAFVDFVDAQAGVNYRVTHYNDPIPRYPAKLLGIVIRVRSFG
ncbi:hypothetical protein G7Y89_g7134 [Cudoniella acicularis]|uniref:Fungal lipase-type domain-containing protein n=1 Tax=Cudoniella acicularis TaxID=354080 RepID=A0A8H4RLQ9_9HELO|nr:hypothetical protein G7Y89_g7134 [Cudoniella acicularis]